MAMRWCTSRRSIGLPAASTISMLKPRNHPSTGHSNRITGALWTAIMSISSCFMPGGMLRTLNGPAVTTTSRLARSRVTWATGTESRAGSAASANIMTADSMGAPTMGLTGSKIGHRPPALNAWTRRARRARNTRGAGGAWEARRAFACCPLPVACCLVSLACCLLPVASAYPQSLLLPNDVPTFEYPLASSRTSAMVGRVIYLDRGESRFGAEWEGEAGLGEIWPLLSLGRRGIPLTLHLGTEVYGRFSLGDAASPMISNDWQVTLVR